MNHLFKLISVLIGLSLLILGCTKKDTDDFYELNKRILAKKGLINSVPNGGNGGGVNPEEADTILFLDVNGAQNQSVLRSFNCPSGVSKMTIKTTCSQGANCINDNPNYADMFVSYGSIPQVSDIDFNYTWTADCASILSNNAEEICNYDNPQAGTWNVVLFGYGIYFFSKLVVIVEYE
jgi:hypothetical protein